MRAANPPDLMAKKTKAKAASPPGMTVNAVSRTTRDGGGTTTLRLSLVRAPRCPNPEADQGLHGMRYALVAGAQVREVLP
ncbi:hypothetical protein GCM10010404_54750 [Nonomuraea africana]